MPYTLHASHGEKIHKHHQIGKNSNFKYLYYLISFYIFEILVHTFEIPLVYRITGSIEGIIFSHFTYFSWVIFSFILFYTFRLRVRTSTLFRWSMFFQILLSIYVMFFYSQLDSISRLIPIFAIRGAGVSLFAIAFHISLLSGLKDKQRDDFTLTFRSIYTLLPVFLPFLGGLIINNLNYIHFPTNSALPDGYFILFLFGSLITGLLLLFSPNIDLYESFNRELSKPFKLLFNKKLHTIRHYEFFNGLIVSIKTIVYGLLGFIILDTELNLGIYASIIALIGSFYFLYIKRFEHKRHVKRISLFMVGLSGEIISQVLFFFRTSFIGLLIKSLSDTLLSPLKGVFGENIIRHRFDILNEKGIAKKTDLILFREIVLYLSRVVGFSSFLLIVRYVSHDILDILKYLILLLAMINIVEYPLMKRIMKES